MMGPAPSRQRKGGGDGCWLLAGRRHALRVIVILLERLASGSARRSSRRRAGSSALPGWWAASLGEGGMEDRLPRFPPPIKPRGCSLILSGSNSPGGKIGDQSLARAKVPGHCRDLLFFSQATRARNYTSLALPRRLCFHFTVLLTQAKEAKKVRIACRG